MGELELSLLEGNVIFQIISYIVTVVIGGVAYKYMKLWFGHREASAQTTQEGNQLLFTNMQSHIDRLTEKMEKFEKERQLTHERELATTKELAKSQAEIRVLQERVKYLEEYISRQDKVIQKYYEQFGELNEKT